MSCAIFCLVVNLLKRPLRVTEVVDYEDIYNRSKDRGLVFDIFKNMEEKVDPRLEYLKKCSMQSLHFKADKFDKMLLVDQLKNIILSFLHTEGIGGLLVLSENAQGQLIPFNNFPNLLKGKGIYFVKTIYEPISPDNILSGLISGDLSSSPLEQLKIVTDEDIFY
ncbi:DNAH17 [Cordylochernes scorpioides]|uniref:DNAH17 n=1 Tax=Cordylochernes scorpioides TaxID=51811 RepID=A0ABY6K7H0_9ARAC|nr:DNAH17 [Cordylochernes scorpioides]